MPAITTVVDAANSVIIVTVTGASNPAEVIRTDQTGNQLAIRDGDPAVLVGGQVVCHDYEAPLDEPVTYQLVTPADFNNVKATSHAVTLPSNGLSWIKNPGLPTLNMPLTLEPPTDPLVYNTTQGVFQVINRANPVVITSKRSDFTGTMIGYTFTLDERDSLMALFEDGGILLFQTPFKWALRSNYVAVGNVSEQWVSEDANDPAREWTIPMIAVDRPIGVASAGVGNAWSDVIATYSSWNALKAAKSNWSNLIRQVTP